MIAIWLTEQELEVVLLCLHDAGTRAQHPDKGLIEDTLDKAAQQAYDSTGKNLLTKAGSWPTVAD